MPTVAKLYSVPQWNARFYIHPLGDDDKRAIHTAMGGKRDWQEFLYRTVAHALRDDNGAAVFTTRQVADLGERTPDLLVNIFNVVMRASNVA